MGKSASEILGNRDASASNANKREGSRTRTAREMLTTTPRIQSVARGYAQGFGDMVSPVAQFLVDKLAYTPQPMDVGGMGQDIAKSTGIPAATDKAGRDFEAFGRGTAFATPFAPLAAVGGAAMGVSPAISALGELGLGGLSEVAASSLTDEGHPNLGMAAGIVLGAGSGPAAATGTSARRVGSALIDNVRLMTPEALALSRQNDLSRGAMVRGSSELKRRTPDVAATIAELRRREEQARSAGMPYGPSSRQVTELMDHGRGGRFYTDAERNLTTTDVDYQRESALRYADNADELALRWEGLSSAEPDYVDFLSKYDDGANALKEEERAAWSTVREGDRPSFNTADIANRAQQIVGSTFFKRKDVPGALAQLADPNTRVTTMNLDRFQELRSVLLGVVRDARRTGLSGDKHAAEMAGQVLDMMGEKMDEFARLDPTGKSAEWQRARALTLENNTFYDINSPVIRTLEAGGQSKNVFSAIRNAKGKRGARTSPAEEAQRLVRIADQTPGGMENLRALAAEDLFADGFNPSATRTPDAVLRRNEEMYRVIFGDQYDQALELLDLSRLHTRGSPGTSAESYRTGSGVSPAAFLFGLAKSSKDPVGASVEGAMKLVGKQNARELEWQRIVRTAVERPEFLRVLLEMPTERALPAWQVQWRQLVARSSARAAAQRGASRSTRESE